MNIVEPIIFNARLNPDAMAICTPGTAIESVTYGELAAMINNVGRAALSAGLRPGEIVAIHVADKIFHWALVLGLARIGIPTVSARGAILPKEIGVAAILADRDEKFVNAGRVVVANMFLWTKAGDGTPPADAELGRSVEEELCRVVLTSGTTGEPKGVAFTHRMIAERMTRYAFGYGNRFPFVRRLFIDLGVTTSPAFRGLIHMLWKGGTAFFFGADPESMVQAFELYGVEAMVTSPHGLSEYVRFYESRPAFRCPFDHLLSQGSNLPPSLSRRVRTWMSPNLFVGYGSTECGRVAAASAVLLSDVPGAVGFLTPGSTVEIVDAADRVLPPGQEGRVRILSRSARGYFNDPTTTAAAFRDGWFYPGDIGRLTAERMLCIHGRENSVLNIGGDKITPERMEAVIADYAGVEESAVFTRPDDAGVERLWAALVIRGRIDEEALRQHCRMRLGGSFAPERFLIVQSLPRNHSGKIDRARLPALAGG